MTAPNDATSILPRDADPERFRRIAETLQRGGLDDLTPESVAWFAEQAHLMQYRLLTTARSLHDLLHPNR